METNELQELLKMTFMSEKLYLEAADRIQNVEITRFLNYQSTTRNNLCNILIEHLANKNVTPSIRYIEKFNGNIADNTKLFFFNSKTTIREITTCINYDKQIIEYCYSLCAVKNISTDIKLFLTKEINKLLASVSKGESFISDVQKKSEMVYSENIYKRTSLN